MKGIQVVDKYCAIPLRILYDPILIMEYLSVMVSVKQLSYVLVLSH